MITLAPTYTHRSYSWTDWKEVKVTKELKTQFDESELKYLIYGYDGPEVHFCEIYKGDVPAEVIAAGYSQVQNDADKAEFEADYKDSANASLIPNVVTYFEKNDKDLKLCAASGTVDAGTGEATLEFPVPGTPGTEEGRYINEGMAFFDEAHAGDKVIAAEVYDKDGIAYPAGTVLKSYVDDEQDSSKQCWFIPTKRGFVEVETLAGYGFIPAGFYLRVKAKKAAGNFTGTFYCNIHWGKKA
jgi:hypothetical protein